MIDPVRQEVIALAHTVVVKVGTNVLTRADGTPGTRPAAGPGRPAAAASRQAAARSLWSAPGPSAPAWAGWASASGPPTCASSRPAPPSARAFLMRAYEDCLAAHGDPDGPDPADRRRLRQPDALPQRPQHHRHPVRVGRACPSSTRTTPSAWPRSVSATTTTWRRWSRTCCRRRCWFCSRVVDGLYAADPTTDPTRELVGTVPTIDGGGPGHGGRQPQRSGHRAACGASSGPPGWRPRPANRSSWPAAHGPDVLDAIFAPSRWARCFCRTAARCRRGSAGWATRPGRRAGWSWTPAPARRCRRKGRSLLPIGVVQVVGHVRQGRRGGPVRRGRRGVRPRLDQLLFRRRRAAARLAHRADPRGARRAAV